MYSFIKNNLYLFIALITVSWAIINNIPINEKTVTKYFFAQKDKNFITIQKNKVNLRNLNTYILNTKSKRKQSKAKGAVVSDKIRYATYDLKRTVE